MEYLDSEQASAKAGEVRGRDDRWVKGAGNDITGRVMLRHDGGEESQQREVVERSQVRDCGRETVSNSAMMRDELDSERRLLPLSPEPVKDEELP